MLFGRKKKQELQQPTPQPSPEQVAAMMRYAQQNMDAMAAMGVQGMPIRGRFGVKDTAYVSRRNCPACGRTLQFQAKLCPACGKPVPPPSVAVPPESSGPPSAGPGDSKL